MIPTIAVLVIALLSAALMGLAIQRGATCLVAAIDELLNHRRAGRALALAEAAVWVGGLAFLATAAGWLNMTPAAYPVSPVTIAGGVLLGIGAWVNRACVFGAVARIGSGEWAYLATPFGFFLGCALPISVAAPTGAATQLGAGRGSAAIASLFFLLLIWRLAGAIRAPHLGQFLWHPHRATLVIAVAFVATLLSAGAWAYTDALAALAQSMDAMLPLRLAMAAALLSGAIAGGAIAGRLSHGRPRAATMLRCGVGGALMGMGSMLVPGSNDGLILLGLPARLAYAWAAVAVMTLSIIIAMRLSAVTSVAGATNR
ncbi:YeeE/YedE thiosulfate transporter family protein [Sphingopyxis solisilvae]|uniref:YeeE/YedE thiosulfate transporter family protein n=1 Tax=Sphingopyxis solisilvae TaxID=1886788 RepID=UPI001892CDF9|nr:YeeE/YedE thiosulfate transporter family protein [Sphingopyxis solisilvae]